MFQTLSHDGCHMIVCQGVVDGFPFPAEFNQCGLFQNPKLMRDSTLCHGQRICNVLHTQFLFGKNGSNSYSGQISKYFE